MNLTEQTHRDGPIGLNLQTVFQRTSAQVFVGNRLDHDFVARNQTILSVFLTPRDQVDEL